MNVTHIAQHRRVVLAALVALAAVAAVSCTAKESCQQPGLVDVCACGGTEGGRICGSDRTWSGCDCSTVLALPRPVVEIDAGRPMAGSGGAGGVAGIGGTGGMSGAGGGGTGGAPLPPPYGKCATAADCQPDSECIITASFPADVNACAPACLVSSECPAPTNTGPFDAVLRCVSGRCRLDCTPVLFAPLLSCPTGMACVAPWGSAAYCYAEPPPASSP